MAEIASEKLRRLISECYARAVKRHARAYPLGVNEKELKIILHALREALERERLFNAETASTIGRLLHRFDPAVFDEEGRFTKQGMPEVAMNEPTIIASQELDENAHVTALLCDTGEIRLQPYSELQGEVKLTPRLARILLSFLLESLSQGGNNEMPSV